MAWRRPGDKPLPEPMMELSMDGDNKLFGPFVDYSVEFYRWKLSWYILSFSWKVP